MMGLAFFGATAEEVEVQDKAYLGLSGPAYWDARDAMTPPDEQGPLSTPPAPPADYPHDEDKPSPPRLGRLAHALVLVLLMVENAAANSGPVLSPGFDSILLVALLMLLSLAGGAYPILARLDPNRNRWWRIALRGIGGFLLITTAPLLARLLRVGDTGFRVDVFVLYVLSLYRSVWMLRWAKQARASAPRSDHLRMANPRRLGLAGVGLMVLPLLAIYTSSGDPIALERILQAKNSARIAVEQAMNYAKGQGFHPTSLATDRGVYPTSLAVLRRSGYANIPDADPWGRLFVLAPVLSEGRRPQAGDDVYVYSKGPCGTGTYEPTRWRKRSDGSLDTGKCGAVGYSSVNGTFTGQGP
jgi:hypothetical protein